MEGSDLRRSLDSESDEAYMHMYVVQLVQGKRFLIISVNAEALAAEQVGVGCHVHESA